MKTKVRPSKSKKTGKNRIVIANRNKIGIRLVNVGHEQGLELRKRLNMTRAVFSRLINASERTIAKVEAEEEPAGKLRRNYNEIARLLTALSEVVDSAVLGTWFVTPNEVLSGLKPIEIIERGEIDRLWDLAWRLQSGTPG
jgi:DNA-binding XRE family transcriptional regulator